MKTIKFSKIVWDTDDEVVDLPSEVTLQVDEDLSVEYDGADVLSDKYGWCVFSFSFEEI